MARKIKNRGTRTATETNADILERIGGSGGAAYRSSRSKRPDILKLKKQSKPLTTKSDAKKMIAANKKTTRPKKKNYAGRTGVIARKAAKVAVPVVAAATGAGVSQWINQRPDPMIKKKIKK